VVHPLVATHRVTQTAVIQEILSKRPYKHQHKRLSKVQVRPLCKLLRKMLVLEDLTQVPINLILVILLLEAVFRQLPLQFKLLVRQTLIPARLTVVPPLRQELWLTMEVVL